MAIRRFVRKLPKRSIQCSNGDDLGVVVISRMSDLSGADAGRDSAGLTGNE